ncbi:anthranilate synthase component I family protein [Hymenobacter properus]|uniref:Anthranilate synthase component 1 n=1 Tax=Hymenobacter properus TaxID=2791026 RepID=A0A931BDB1_9BACT|nr:anthranilate synthase component I family protein [Hymenobacter properus]MBF9140438.1 anthranilate synthase component I family protein [Hymenobacter properus]MBR7719245.1 anthranilate synthase component I family protein [Microvirga sp. SRT04]
MLPLTTRHRRLLADTVTPVGLYLRLRDQYSNCLLLESADYHGQQNAFSYLVCEPLATFELRRGGELHQQLPGAAPTREQLASPRAALARLRDFAAAFAPDETAAKLPFISTGLFGYIGYEAVQSFEDVQLATDKVPAGDIPLIRYGVYRYVIAFNHFRQELHLFEHGVAGEENAAPDGLDRLENLVRNPSVPSFGFATVGEEQSNQTDAEFLARLAQGQAHCRRGDVFQIVLSRRFQQGFSGDEFNVYRALRSINPSPYLFYFDYGDYKIFGSSPEAQVLVQGREASLFPIAGTYRRTGDDAADAAAAQRLAADPKENAEHVMLVDLARNDLARHGTNVQVRTLREIQFYSHVIHLVSKVTAELPENTDTLQVVADTFPAGTLSGAPKHRAIQLIDGLEPTARGYYGGCLGHLGFDGSFNHAIMIRSFLSTGNQLYFQAGAGVVAASNVQSELEEVHHKLGALRAALRAAEAVN